MQALLFRKVLYNRVEMSHDSGKPLWDNHPTSNANIDHYSVIVTTTNNLLHIGSQHNCLMRLAEISKAREGAYVFKLRRVRTLFVNQRRVCLHNTTRDQVIQLHEISICIPTAQENDLLPASISPGLDDPSIFCRMAKSQSSC